MSNGTGVAAVDSLVVWSLALVAIAALAGLLWRGVAALRRLIRRIDYLVDDWTGTPARPGVPARPGAMERIGSIEETMGRMDERLQVVEHEVRPNSGRSMRDAVDRVDRRTAQIVAEE
ncbi:hypothetical protein [Streptomyces sp. DH37]|uniref:hypothetical protein n=1 Tax=Streptomyces sp. DH37 TaxID=3040122 RepID=UPI00244183EF|nr:hypothetical protein [Streptomyces sp. DH37]MDG9705534.1 hypothetical protein [Streptomyces sp. DH37]